MNVELTYKEVWATLNALDLSEYHDKKGNFTSDNYGFLTLEGSGDHVSEHDSAEKRIKFK